MNRIDAPPTRGNPLAGLLQIRLGKLMAVVAVIGVLFWACLFRFHYLNADRAYTTLQIGQLDHPDPARRRLAAENLARVEPADLSRAVQALLGSLDDPDEEVRRATVVSIQRAIADGFYSGKMDVTRQVATVVPSILRAMNDRKPSVRMAAINALGRLGFDMNAIHARSIPLTPETVIGLDPALTLPELLKRFEDPDAGVRECASRAYGLIAAPSGGDAEPLRTMVERDSSSAVRITALQTLAEHWPDDPALPERILRRLKKETDLAAMSNCGWLLSRAIPDRFPPALYPELARALSRGNPVVNYHVLAFFKEMGSGANAYLPEILESTRGTIRDDSERQFLLKILANCRPVAADPRIMIEPLRAMARETETPFVRGRARALIRAIDEWNPEPSKK